jgi:signal transduction histidine kinase
MTMVRERIGSEAMAFGLLRGLTLVVGMAALFIVPLRPEHQLHLAPLLAGFIAYNAVVLVVLARWAAEARSVFLATLAADLALVFLLVWFTGGGESHFYVLFYMLVTINAYYFGPVIGVLAAMLASGLLAIAHWLALSLVSWPFIAARAIILGVIAMALGHVAVRERVARANAERLNREMDTTMTRLARAEQLAAVGRLSAKMAHEVRNPLGAISLNVDMLGDIIRELTGPVAGAAQEVFRGIRQEIRALADLTDEYLIAARLPRPKLEKDSVNELVTELADFLRPVAEGQGISIAVSLDEGLPAFPFDRAMLRQAMRNLVRNAMEALPKGGRVELSTRCEGITR